MEICWWRIVKRSIRVERYGSTGWIGEFVISQRVVVGVTVVTNHRRIGERGVFVDRERIILCYRSWVGHCPCERVGYGTTVTVVSRDNHGKRSALGGTGVDCPSDVSCAVDRKPGW